MLFNLGKFVSWPHGALGEPGSALRICVIGRDPFGPVIDALGGRSLQERIVEVERHTDAPATICQIAFVSVPRAREATVVEALAEAPTLVVGDSEGFATRGGMVNMAVVDAKIRFRINLAAARRAGIGLSARLLNLATVIKR